MCTVIKKNCLHRLNILWVWRYVRSISWSIERGHILYTWTIVRLSDCPIKFNIWKNWLSPDIPVLVYIKDELQKNYTQTLSASSVLASMLAIFRPAWITQKSSLLFINRKKHVFYIFVNKICMCVIIHLF